PSAWECTNVRPRPSHAVWGARGGVVEALALISLLYVFSNKEFRSDALAAAVVLAIGALSLNVLVGYAGQISLGHQAFIGVGAFTSAYVISQSNQSFYVGLDRKSTRLNSSHVSISYAV